MSAPRGLRSSGRPYSALPASSVFGLWRPSCLFLPRLRPLSGCTSHYQLMTFSEARALEGGAPASFSGPFARPASFLSVNRRSIKSEEESPPRRRRQHLHTSPRIVTVEPDVRATINLSSSSRARTHHDLSGPVPSRGQMSQDTKLCSF